MSASLNAYAWQTKSSVDDQRGQVLIARTAEAINPIADDQPVLLKGKFRLPNLTQGELDGDWVLVAAPGDRSHLQLRAAGVSLDIWTEKELEWQQPLRILPLPVRRLIEAFQLRDLILRPYPTPRYKIVDQKVGSVIHPCVELERARVRQFAVCADEMSGVPSRIDYGNVTFQFADLQSVGSKPFPLKVTGKAGDEQILEIKVGSIAGIAKLDPVLILPPQGAIPTAGPRCPWGELKKKTNPEYPPLAKTARIQGMVEFHGIIDQNGKVKSLELVSGHPMLAESAKKAVADWEYTPMICNGKPIELETYITVNFNLSGSP